MNTANAAHFKTGNGKNAAASIRTLPGSVSQIGFWSAVSATVCSIEYGIAATIVLISSLKTEAESSSGWNGIKSFVASFQPIGMLPLIPSLLLVPAFITLMVSIHYYAVPDKKIWSHIGIAFTLVYAVMASINYITQSTVVRLSILNKETDGLAMFAMGNPHSIFWALASAYVFMNLAMLFTAPIFDDGKLEWSIHWLFLVNGASAMVTTYGVAADSPQIYLMGSLVSWCVIFSWATILLAIMFKRNERIAS